MALSEQTKDLAQAAVVADMTAPGSLLTLLTPNTDSANDYFAKYEEANCNWVSITVATDGHGATVESCATYIAKARNWFSLQPDRFVLVDNADDVLRAKSENKLAVSFHFQGTAPFVRDLNLIQLYRKLGVTHALLAANVRNLVGDGFFVPNDAGLSAYGADVIAEMNRVGMMVDLSHTGYKTSMDALEVSTAPVIMSHCSPKAVFDHARNVPDDQIIAMAKTGGVIGIHGVGMYMSEEGEDVSAGLVCDFVEYTVDLIGAEHVGFGLDFTTNTQLLAAVLKEGGEKTWPKGQGYFEKELMFSHPNVILEVAEMLLQKNYSEEAVKGIMGDNWLRVFREVCG